MTFFGQDGTKTGISKRLYIISLWVLLNSAPAFAGFGGESTATTYAGGASSIFTMPPIGSTTPPTMSRPVPAASGAYYPGQMNIRAVKPFTSYRIRNDLSLEVVRTFTVKLWPQLENANAALPDGWYLLRFVVVLPDEKYYARKRLGLPARMSEEERYVTSKKVLGYYSRTYNGGVIEVTFDMVLPDITRGMARSDLYVKLSQIDQASVKTINGRVDQFSTAIVREVQTGMIPLVPIAQFTPMKDKDDPTVAVPDARRTDPIAADLDGYVRRSEAFQEQKLKDEIFKKFGVVVQRGLPDFSPTISEDDYAKNPKWGNLQMLDPYSPELVTSLNWHRYDMPSVPKYLNQKEIVDLLPVSYSGTQQVSNRMDPSVSRALCSHLARMQGVAFSSAASWIIKCSNYPYYYMSIHKNIHVRSMDTNGTSARVVDVFPFQVISNFSLNHSSSTDLSFSVGLNPSNLFPLSAFGEALKLSPLGITGSVGQGESDSIVDSGISQTFKSFKIKQYFADIPIQRYRACVAFEIDEHFFPAKVKTRGLYICENESEGQKLRPMEFTESYYFAMQDTLGEEDVSPQALNLLFRGDRDVNTFLGVAGRFISSIKKNQLGVGAAFQNAAYVYSRMPGAVPGMISLPMVPKDKLLKQENPDEVSKTPWYRTLLSYYQH